MLFPIPWQISSAFCRNLDSLSLFPEKFVLFKIIAPRALWDDNCDVAHKKSENLGIENLCMSEKMERVNASKRCLRQREKICVCVCVCV